MRTVQQSVARFMAQHEREATPPTRAETPDDEDGGRCPHCRKKIELDTHYKAMCNGFCDTAKRGSKSGCVSKVVARWK